MALEMKVAGLTVDPFTNTPIIILKDLEEKNAIPIWIGILEASAITTELEKIRLARPMTHDLIKNILDSLGMSMVKIVVTDLRDNTFFAALHLLTSRKDDIIIDSRPSDAIALALRMGCPIYVEERVVEKSKKIDPAQGQPGDKLEGDKWKEFLENLPPDEFGKYKM